MTILRSYKFPNGFSLRQILKFASAANQFQSQVSFASDGYLFNSKGVLGMVLFFSQFPRTEEIQLIIEGTDANEATTILESILYAGSTFSVGTKS
ncbi:HPr family phosphocarrier protein [Paenibacillus sp. RC67]|uniref:HPr family phosphocarrier protein n=1 Tax=Paenibacillus sp. RC67 TaxID=3039392 RepID=UPI0024AE49A8|nr:HPr family phosphocarrier protein [Paenibacillus sp. RC67]